MVEYGVAKFALSGPGRVGHQHLVCCNHNGILVAAIDGIGHGEELPMRPGQQLRFLRNSATNQLSLS